MWGHALAFGGTGGSAGKEGLGGRHFPEACGAAGEDGDIAQRRGCGQLAEAQRLWAPRAPRMSSGPRPTARQRPSPAPRTAGAGALVPALSPPPNPGLSGERLGKRRNDGVRGCAASPRPPSPAVSGLQAPSWLRRPLGEGGWGWRGPRLRCRWLFWHSHPVLSVQASRPDLVELSAWPGFRLSGSRRPALPGGPGGASVQDFRVAS